MDNLESIDSRFRLAILAAKRAKQLVNGAKPRVEITAENPISIAIEEIRQGMINFHILAETEREELSRDNLFRNEENEREDEDIDNDLLLDADTDDFDEEEEDEEDEEYEVEEEDEEEGYDEEVEEEEEED